MERIKKIKEAINRQRAVEQGFYDGRYREKVVPNKKKWSKKLRKHEDIDFPDGGSLL